jgi:hypothetical protein
VGYWAGLALPAQEVAAWETADQFAGQTQRLVFRRCAPAVASPGWPAGRAARVTSRKNYTTGTYPDSDRLREK